MKTQQEKGGQKEMTKKSKSFTKRRRKPYRGESNKPLIKSGL